MKKSIIATLITFICAALFAQNAASDFTIDINGVITKYNGWDTAVVIPETINGIRVTAIGERAFAFTDLTSVTIPRGVTSIGRRAFSFSKLTSITVDNQNPAYSSVDGILFNKNKTVLITYPERKQGTSYTIPSSVTSIGEYAFYNCRSLTSITIPASVTSVGERAFSSFESLISITIPSSVTSIGRYAFYECKSLTSITIPSGVTSIGDRVFQDCRSLTSITIPSSVTSIGDWAFLGCTRLTSVTVSRGTTIGRNAFSSKTLITYSD
jgi:hypothetical protein